MKRPDEQLGQVVNEGDEAGLGRSTEELEHKTNDQKRVDYSHQQPDGLLSPQTRLRSNSRHFSRRSVFVRLLHPHVTDDLRAVLRIGRSPSSSTSLCQHSSLAA